MEIILPIKINKSDNLEDLKMVILWILLKDLRIYVLILGKPRNQFDGNSEFLVVTLHSLILAGKWARFSVYCNRNMYWISQGKYPQVGHRLEMYSCGNFWQISAPLVTLRVFRLNNQDHSTESVKASNA